MWSPLRRVRNYDDPLCLGRDRPHPLLGRRLCKTGGATDGRSGDPLRPGRDDLQPRSGHHVSRASGADLKLDVYRPSNATRPTPVLMFMHGGGWTNGSKNSSVFAFLPFLEMGWAVANVGYRLAA